nr:unnamed protein product [Callosobruchus analis]
MDSTIERQIRNRKINLPADYTYYCQKARSSPSPYNVKYTMHTFKLFDGLKFYSSIRPGRSVGDPVVTDIKALIYFPDCKIQYKLRRTDTWRILRWLVTFQKVLISCLIITLSCCYVFERTNMKQLIRYLCFFLEIFNFLYSISLILFQYLLEMYLR